MSCWIQTLPSWIQTPCYHLSDSLKNTLTPIWLWLKLIQSDSNSFILILTWWWQPSWILPTSIPHLGFSHLSFSSQTHPHLPRLDPTICTKKTYSQLPLHHLHKKTSLIHSDSTWWWQPSWILPCWIQTHGILYSDTLLSSLRFTQKYSHSSLTLNLTNLIWLKLIHSHLTWWRQPPWILPSWIQLFCTKKLHLFILTQLDDGSDLEFCHIEFSHLGFSHFTQNSDSN